MAVFDTFSKRKAQAEKQGKPDVFQYTDIPQGFRVQVVHIWKDALGPYIETSSYSMQEAPASTRIWEAIHDILARELGVFRFGEEFQNHFERCVSHLLAADTDPCLDAIEVSFRVVDRVVREWDYYKREKNGIQQDADEAIGELNARFREHAIGYQYESGRIIQLDSEFLHDQTVRPALELLRDSSFSGASEEFLKAHEHYRKGNHSEAMVEALKALESTMKYVCDERSWMYPENATASQLVEIVFKNELIPGELLSEFQALRSTLESGVPTVRNRKAGHGQGSKPREVPEYLAAYVLHLTASSIVFLVRAHREKA